MLQVICFTTSIKIKVLVELTRSEFPWQTSFPAKRVSLQNQFQKRGDSMFFGSSEGEFVEAGQFPIP